MKMKILLVFFLLLSLVMTFTAYVLFTQKLQEQMMREVTEEELNKAMRAIVLLKEELNQARESQ